MVKKVAKKVAKKRKIVKKAPVKALPMKDCPTSCSCDSSVWLCKISLIAAIFFVMSVLPKVGMWVMNVHWGIWLIIALVLGWKPLMHCLRK